MKDSVARQIVLKQIMEAMNEDSANALSFRLKKNVKDEDKKEKKTIKLSDLSDIRSMLK